jgi:hypothetical protein
MNSAGGSSTIGGSHWCPLTAARIKDLLVGQRLYEYETYSGITNLRIMDGEYGVLVKKAWKSVITSAFS